MKKRITCPECNSKDVIVWEAEYTCATCGCGWDAEAEQRRQARIEEEKKWRALDK